MPVLGWVTLFPPQRRSASASASSVQATHLTDQYRHMFGLGAMAGGDGSMRCQGDGVRGSSHVTPGVLFV